ncbi:MAG: slipin family protein [Hafnia sp.]|jgi:regulator of protease activity HflC (stomatin/prohibitin superfamily)|uniref:slipin family protein n=1 Tax=Hafnia TaxID=568 RepID=UPI0001F06401|nr:slipin family protein [Hafnia paralvei]EFV40031.1 hypothetical protein HMPREF0864_02487 [Enterobacteriaceae bacterium 9_2_54FAA]AMH18028.1 slipin family protein [Hafnia paralvei]MCE9882713.1 slipin family protein [Hafnia paralvei]MCE9907057.1 slipin family protein [Hafnia paralvei]MCE9911723.1 slipin family protein [Hafnia paralvei]
MRKNIIIQKGQIGLLTKKGDYQKVLEAGEYRFFDWTNQLAVTVVNLSDSRVEPALAEHLRSYQPEWVERYCTAVDLSEQEIGLRYENDILQEILPPGTRRLYWLNGNQQRIERIEANNVEVPSEIVAALHQPKLRNRTIKGGEGVLLVQVPAWHVGILKIDGATQALLSPGISGYWRFNHAVEAEIVDTRLQVLEVSGQEILTRDKVNLRLNLAANWRYSDVLQSFALVAKPLEHIYRELQFALREAVGTRTLDELLENKQIIDDIVSEQVSRKLVGYGIEVVSLGVKDIVLPGDMKTILSRVVEAEKLAQANVIRRREETSATRSLLNTAKVMENNPVALRLKELETLERVAERIDKISVFGGLDQVLNGLIQIKGV